MTENKYAQMCRQSARNHEGMASIWGDEYSAIADDWHKAADAFEALIKACETGVIALDLYATLSPDVRSDGLASAHKQLLIALRKAGA
jgi:hypothetical protein